jgi:MFS family permease
MTPSSTEPDRSAIWLHVGVLAMLSLAAVGAYLTRHCIAVANTRIQAELSLSPEQMGWILGAFSLGYFVFQVPGGWLGNRVGTRVAYPLISIIWSLMTFASSFAGTWLTLGATRAAFGAAQAGFVPLSAQVIRDWFRENQRGFCSAVMSASMSLGGVIAMGLTAWLLTMLHWREVFRLYSLVGIVWAVAFYLFFRDRPEQHPWTGRELQRRSAAMESSERPSMGRTLAETQEHVDSAAGRKETVYGMEQHDEGVVDEDLLSGRALAWRIATNRTLWGINLQSYFRSAGYALLVTWLPAFLEYRFDVSEDQSGFYTMYPLACVIVGSLLGGLTVDRVLTMTGSKWLSRVGLAIVGLGACAALTFASSWATTPGGFVALIAAGAWMSGFANPPAWAATMDVSGRHTAVILGVMNMASTAGGFMLPVVLGYMIGDIQETEGDWNQVIYFVAIIYLAGALSWLLVDPTDTPSAQASKQ